MLKRLYADNYRCLVNFEIEFEPLTLLAGLNGGGKTSVFDLLFGLRRLLVDNAKIGEVFPARDLNAWMKRNEQKFEMEVIGEEGKYLYTLTIAHDPQLGKQRIEKEGLTIDGAPLFSFEMGEVQLYRDDHSRGPGFSYDWGSSGLGTVASRHDNTKLTWFKDWIDKLFIVHLDPRAMTSETLTEATRLGRDAFNFASWYRFLSQEHQDKVFDLVAMLRQAVPGFHAFKLEQAGHGRILKAGFDNGNGSAHYFDFEHISDGQRVLMALYTLLLGLKDLGHALFIDEPENFVALPEIQPWLMELNDACQEGFPQAVLISHHPELIDYLGPEFGKWIEREPGGPARVKPLAGAAEGGLRLSERVARGWTE